MKLGELMALMSYKDGDELFEKTSELLKRIGVSMYNEEGSYKDTHTLLCDIAEVWNNNTK